MIDAPEIDSFTLPGGFLYLNSGLIQVTSSEAELAGVLAHGIAHIGAHHWAALVTKVTLAQLSQVPITSVQMARTMSDFVPINDPVYPGARHAHSADAPLAFLKFRRDYETEADDLGLLYMYKAGYDPGAYNSFLEKLLKEEQIQNVSTTDVFMERPRTSDRIRRIERDLKRFPPRGQYLENAAEFSAIQARVKKWSQ